MNEEIVPFGKYKGQPLSALQGDKKYLAWLTAQDWFRANYPQINTIIINNFQVPSESPDHNRIQAMFTDDDFCEKMIRYLVCNGYAASQANKEMAVAIERATYTPEQKRTMTRNEWNAIDVDMALVVREWYSSYEVRGVDVIFRCGFSYLGKWVNSSEHWIEIKPSVSDDYPAILRQMQNNHSQFLLTESYTGEGATLEQVRKIFASSGKTIILLFEL